MEIILSFDELAASLRGELVTPDSADYNDVRAVFNAMIDKKPAAIARCVDAADVQTCVNYGRDNSIPLAIRAVVGGVTSTMPHMRMGWQSRPASSRPPVSEVSLSAAESAT